MSDDFEKFYKFFDMKEQFDKTSLAPLNIEKQKLVTTTWFKEQIIDILGL